MSKQITKISNRIAKSIVVNYLNARTLAFMNTKISHFYKTRDIDILEIKTRKVLGDSYMLDTIKWKLKWYDINHAAILRFDDAELKSTRDI